MSSEQAAQLSQRAAMPFAGAAAQPPAASVSTAATPWGAQPVPAAPAAAPGEMTLGPGRDEAPGESTFALRPEHHAAALQRVVAPFAVATAAPASVRAEVPGAPWSGGPATPAPLPAAVGEETMALGGPPRPLSSHVAPPPSLIAQPVAEPQPTGSAPKIAGHEALAERLRSAGVSGDDVALLLGAITPPAPSPDAG